MGVICAITPRIARFYGAQDNNEITQEAQQGLILAALLGVIAMFGILLFIDFVENLRANEEVTIIAQGYLSIIAYSMPVSGVCWAVFAILEGHGMMRFVVCSSITAVCLNIVLDYIFVFGKFGAPALGGVGCAWTTTIIYWLWGFSALIYLVRHRALKHYAVFTQWRGVILSRWKAILALGTPISLALLAEEGFFNITTLMIAPLGTEALGAHQITIQILAIVSMVGFGVGQATAIRVAHSIGKKDIDDMYTNLKVGAMMVFCFSVVVGIFVFWGRDMLPMLFTQDSSIALISTAIMFFAPFYLIADVLHIWAAQSLRGFEDTKVPMLLQVFSYWMVGFPLGYSLAITELWGTSYGIYGFWAGLATGVSLGGVLLCSRLYAKLNQCSGQLRISH